MPAKAAQTAQSNHRPLDTHGLITDGKEGVALYKMRLSFYLIPSEKSELL